MWGKRAFCEGVPEAKRIWQRKRKNNTPGGTGKGNSKGRFKGLWIYSPTGFGYQGICHNCGEVGHKRAECTRPRRINELEGVPQAPQVKETMDLGRVWQVGSVEVSQTPFARLGRMEEEEEDREDWICDVEGDVPGPPAPLGPGLCRATFRKGNG